MKKYIISLAITLVVVALIVVVYYQKFSNSIDNQFVASQPVADETLHWKIYTNSSKGYSVLYPPALVVDDSNLDQITIGDGVAPYLNITVYQLKQNTDLQSFVQERLINDFHGLLATDEIKWVTINNDYSKIGVKFPNKAGGHSGELYWLYIGHDYKVYRIATLGNYDSMTQNEFQNKIISGFKFVD